MTPGEWALLALLSVLWGGTFLFQAVAVKEVPPLTLVFARLALAALILAGVVRAMGLALPRGWAVWGALAGMAVLNNVIPFSLFAYGQTQIGAGLAAILNATTPLFTVAVAHLLTADEKATRGKLAGVLLGLAGVAIMIGPALLGRVGENVPAQLACLGGALSYAFSGIQGRRLQAFGLAPVTTAAGQVIASSLILLPAVLLVDRPWLLPMPSGAAVLCIAALAALSTALAYIIFFRILATAGATNLLLVTFLIPVTAIGLGILFLGERLELAHLAGMVLIGCGLAAIDGRVITHLRTRL
jgi:drug/metabolite transporter (DMT)-like permease